MAGTTQIVRSPGSRRREPAGSPRRGAQVGIPARHQVRRQHQQGRRQHPGEGPRHQHPADGLLGQQPVEHQRPAGGQEQPQGAPHRRRGGREAVVVAVAAHLGHRHHGHGQGGGHGGAADGGEEGAGPDGGHGQGPPHVAQEGRREAEQVGPQVGPGQGHPHQDEHGDHAQPGVADDPEGVQPQPGQRGPPVDQDRLPAGGHQHHAQPHRDAQRQQRQQPRQGQQAHHLRRHDRGPPARVGRARRCAGAGLAASQARQEGQHEEGEAGPGDADGGKQGEVQHPGHLAAGAGAEHGLQEAPGDGPGHQQADQAGQAVHPPPGRRRGPFVEQVDGDVLAPALGLAQAQEGDPAHGQLGQLEGPRQGPVEGVAQGDVEHREEGHRHQHGPPGQRGPGQQGP